MPKRSTVGDIMSRNPITVASQASVIEAARHMRDSNVGAVLVEDRGNLCGIVTDRDLAVRVVAKGASLEDTKVGEVCSSELAMLTPDDDADNAVSLMRKKGIRRIPVQKDGSPVGILSLGDLALDRDPKSALGGISGAAPNV